MLQKMKYTFILFYSRVTNRTVVDLFGTTYVVAGNYVRRIR